MTTCHQDICPHMHFNKCYAERIRSIPVSIFPDPTIDSFTNVNVKCGKQYKSNIPTLAYEKFTECNEALQEERNFIKDFYMENFEKDKMILNNNIVNQLKQQMYRNSAYVLAQGATKDYNNFQENRKRALTNARNRAISAYQAHQNHLKQQKQKDFQENGYWLKKLFRKLQQVAKHIIQGNGEDATQKQKQYLLSKSNLTANFLCQIKIKNPKNAFDILEQVRILMQKKKLQFSDQKEQQELNKSVSMSFASQVSQNTSQNSMLSQATSMNQTNALGQDEIVNQYWNFTELKKKWKIEDVEAVKQMIRRVLTKKIVFEAELQAVKRRKQASQINKRIIQSNKKQNVSKGKNEQKGKTLNKDRKSVDRKRVQSVIETKPVQNIMKNTLSKGQQLAKAKIIQGGRFDAIGQKFLRNKTYSEIFKNKESDIKSLFVQNTFQNTSNKQTINSHINKKQLEQTKASKTAKSKKR